MGFYITDQLLHFCGRGITHCVRNVQNTGSRLLRRVKHLHQIISVTAGSVFSGKLNIRAHAFGIGDHLFHLCQNLFPCFMQLCLQMDIAGG